MTISFFFARARANELFDILDEDGSGAIDQHEFIEGIVYLTAR